MNSLEYHQNYYQGTRKELIEKLKQSLNKQSRFEHCLRVEQTAIKLAQLNDANVEKVSIAGLLHDYAKERSTEEFRQVIQTKQLDSKLLNWGNFIWHGEVGAEIVKDELQITDNEILDAIRHHTVGAVEMTTLDKIIYVADYIEPGRDFPGVDFARNIAFQNLDDAVKFETKQTLEYLMSNNKKIYPAAILTYNSWVAGQ
ncbi:bis(5'-nucleosyl)-tetraphosphatase (symmetrical) YqeK [Ligilactobacillus sp. LYQ135]